MEFLRPMSNHQFPKKNFAPSRYLFWLSPIIRLGQVGVTHIISLNQSINQSTDQSINDTYISKEHGSSYEIQETTFYLVYRYSTCHPRLLVDKFTRIFIHIPSDGASYVQLPSKKIQIVFCINVQTFHKTVFNARELERGIRVLENVGLLPLLTYLLHGAESFLRN
jgi:hypothetical protein